MRRSPTRRPPPPPRFTEAGLALVALARQTASGLADDGTVYNADRENPRIYALSTDGTLSLLVQDKELSEAVVGQNALLVLPDQSALLSLVYLPSRLLHVRLPDGAVTRVDIDGDFSDGLPPLSGDPDPFELVRFDGTLP